MRSPGSWVTHCVGARCRSTTTGPRDSRSLAVQESDRQSLDGPRGLSCAHGFRQHRSLVLGDRSSGVGDATGCAPFEQEGDRTPDGRVAEGSGAGGAPAVDGSDATPVRVAGGGEFWDCPWAAGERGDSEHDVRGVHFILFIYLLMGFLFESFILPLSIIFTIPAGGDRRDLDPLHYGS
jgi:hypothetical protein